MPDDGSTGEELARVIQRRNNGQVVKLLAVMGRKEAVDYITRDGSPLLHVAILHHNYHATRLLLDRGADPNFKDERGRTALHAAAEADNVRMVVDLLKKCSVNTQDKNGDSPLHVAVQKTSVEMVKWLIFGGADPYLTNSKGVACRTLTNKNLIHQLLRDFRRTRPHMTFARLQPGQPHHLQPLQLSLALCSPSAQSGAGVDFLYYTASHWDLSAAKLGNLQDDEEVWSSVVDYRMVQPVDVTLNFPLLDVLSVYNELVMRLLSADTYECRDIVLDVEEIEPTTNVAVVAGAAVNITSSDSSSTATSSESDVMYVAKADGRTQLDEGGTLFLLCRPVQQAVTLGRGVNKIRARMDDRVELSVPEDFEGQLKGELQLEPSPPVKEEAALIKAPPGQVCEYECQTDYIKLKTADKSGTVTADLTVDLPVPQNFSGGVLNVVVRTFSIDSIDSGPLIAHRTFSIDSTDSGPLIARRSSVPPSSDGTDESAASDSEAEDEKECRRWTRKATFSVPRDAQTMKVPMEANKTLTVVETKRTTSEEKLKKHVARQYRKRHHKQAVFFVAGRPWIGWRKCREVLVVITSPNHLARELGRHLADGYSLLHVSGEFRVAPLTQFRVSVLGDLLVQHGDWEAVITFQNVLHAERSRNHCIFILLRKDERVSEGRFRVEQKRRKAKKTKTGDPGWKLKGELHFDMTAIGEDIKPPNQEEQELVKHFSDTLLLELAERLPVSECPVLGQRIGLDAKESDRILHNPSLLSPLFKCLELLRRQRDRSKSAVEYGRSLVTALRDMDCNEQCQWLLKRLRQWPRVKEVGG